MGELQPYRPALPTPQKRLQVLKPVAVALKKKPPPVPTKKRELPKKVASKQLRVSRAKLPVDWRLKKTKFKPLKHKRVPIPGSKVKKVKRVVHRRTTPGEEEPHRRTTPKIKTVQELVLAVVEEQRELHEHEHECEHGHEHEHEQQESVPDPLVKRVAAASASETVPWGLQSVPFPEPINYEEQELV